MDMLDYFIDVYLLKYHQRLAALIILVIVFAFCLIGIWSVAAYRRRKIQERKEEMKGLFYSLKEEPKQLKWMQYPKNVRWIVVRTPRDFEKALKEQRYQIYSFEFSIGNYETGLDLLKDMCNRLKATRECVMPLVYFHERDDKCFMTMKEYWRGFTKRASEGRW